jgi:uncharacterized protein YggE
MRTLLLATALIVLSLTDIQAQNAGSKLVVRGEAVLYDVPSNMSIQIPITAKDVSYEACSDKLMAQYNELAQALSKRGIEAKEVKSGRVDISENFTYTDGGRKQDGYVGSIQVSLELPHTDKTLNDVINTLKEERFNFGYSLGFVLSESQKTTLREEAIKVAIADAKAKANVIAASLNMQLVAVQEVMFGDLEGGSDMLMGRHDFAMMKSEGANDIEVQLNPVKLEIRKSITIHWLMAK